MPVKNPLSSRPATPVKPSVSAPVLKSKTGASKQALKLKLPAAPKLPPLDEATKGTLKSGRTSNSGPSHMVSLLSEQKALSEGTWKRRASGQRGAAEGMSRWAPPSARPNTLPPIPEEAAPTTEATFAGTVQISGTRVDEGVGHTTTGSAQRMGINLGHKLTLPDGTTVGGSVFMNGGFVSAGGSTSFNLEDRLSWAGSTNSVLYGNLAIGGWRGQLGVGGNASLATEVGTFAVGAWLSKSAERDVRYLGPYQGQEASLQNKQGVEVSYKTGTSGRITPGFAQGQLGIGGRLQLAREKTITHRTHLTPAAAEAETFRRFEGVGGAIRGRLEAMGLFKKSLDIPNLKKPETFGIGDEVVVETKGSFTGGLVLGGLGAAASVAGTMEGRFSLGVRKLDEHHVEVAVSPEKMKGISFSGKLPIASAQASKSVSLALRQAFVFDLREPEARAAYQKVLKGELPTSLSRVGEVRPDDDARLLAVVQHEELPLGIHRTCLEKAEVPVRIKGLSTGLLIIPKDLGVGKFGYHHIKVDSRHVITDGQVALSSKTRGREKERETFFSGVESSAISATVRHATISRAPGQYSRIFDRLILNAKIADTRVKGNEHNHRMVEPLNQVFGHNVGPFTQKGQKETRELTIEQSLTPEHLESLKEITAEQVHEVCEVTGADETATLDFLGTMALEYEPWGQARLIQSYVNEHKLAGFGTLHRLLGHRDALLVKTTSDAYERPIEDTHALQMKYPDPVQANEDKHVIRKRFRESFEILQAIKDSLKLLDDDPILETFDKEAVERNRSRLISAQRDVQKVLNLEHLPKPQRLAIYKQTQTKAVLMEAAQLQQVFKDPITPNESKSDLIERFSLIRPTLNAVHWDIDLLGGEAALGSRSFPEHGERLHALIRTKANLTNALSFEHLSPVERHALYTRLGGENAARSVRSRNRGTMNQIIARLAALGAAEDPSAPAPRTPSAP